MGVRNGGAKKAMLSRFYKLYRNWILTYKLILLNLCCGPESFPIPLYDHSDNFEYDSICNQLVVYVRGYKNRQTTSTTVLDFHFQYTIPLGTC